MSSADSFDAAEEVCRAWMAGLAPDPSLTVSQWADRHRVLSSRAASEAGPYRTARTPYMKAVMDALSPRHPAQRVVFMKAAQVGATEAGNNWIGFCIHRAPGPFLAVQPTVDLAKRLSQQRIDPLIEESPDLRALVLPSRSRDAGNPILGKRFPGGQLILTGANSAVGLRSMPARWVFLDEVEAYPGDVDGEGDPIALAEARTISFGHRSKVFLASTPTLKGLSRIEREWELSDQQRYHVPCPHCGGLQWLQFERLRWEPGPIGIAITALFDNIGRLTTYAATFAAPMAGRWVAGLAAAALSVRGLATGLVILRGALIRTGIGALIVGAGELVFQFTKLVSGAGSFGNAMGLLKDVVVEVWEQIKMGATAAGAAASSMFFDIKADAASGMQSAIESVVGFGNTAANTFEGAFEAIKAIWGLLPAAIGDLAFQAANSLIEGVESMLNGVVARINGFIEGVNSGLEALGSERRITLLGDLDLGEIENRFAGAATQAGTAAKEAFDRAFENNPLAVPGLGLNDIAREALTSANSYRTAASDLAAGALAPLTSWQALQAAVAGAGTEGEAALEDATDAADQFDESITAAGRAAGGAGAAAADGAEAAKTGWEAAAATLADYAAKARDIGGDIGQTLVGAFQSAENAVAEFIKTGKLDFRSLVTSMIADLAKLAARRFILGPIANALSGALGDADGLFADILHSGGTVGMAGGRRMVPALAFANAPRMHSGGWAGLKPDEVPAILQRGERVLSRREAAGYGQGQSSAPVVNVTIMSRDAESFRQSRTQVAADIARAVSAGRRGM